MAWFEKSKREQNAETEEENPTWELVLWGTKCDSDGEEYEQVYMYDSKEEAHDALKRVIAATGWVDMGNDDWLNMQELDLYNVFIRESED